MTGVVFHWGSASLKTLPERLCRRKLPFGTDRHRQGADKQNLRLGRRHRRSRPPHLDKTFQSHQGNGNPDRNIGPPLTRAHGLVQHIECLASTGPLQFGGELDALRFAAREFGGGLSQAQPRAASRASWNATISRFSRLPLRLCGFHALCLPSSSPACCSDPVRKLVPLRCMPTTMTGAADWAGKGLDD